MTARFVYRSGRVGRNNTRDKGQQHMHRMIRKLGGALIRSVVVGIRAGTKRFRREPLQLVVCLLVPILATSDAIAEDAQVLEGYVAYEQATRSGDYAAAVAPVQEALERARILYDDGHETVALLSFHYGRALYRDGQRVAAYAALETAREQYALVFGAQSVDMATVLLALGDAAETAGIARARYDEAVAVSSAANGERSVAHAQVLLKAGSGLLEVHRAGTDAGLLVAAHEVLSEVDNAPSGLRAEAAVELGKLRLMQGRIDRAESLSLEAVSLDQGERSAPAHTMLVKIYESRGERDAATPHALAVGRLRNARDSADDYLPLHRVAPSYPRNALFAGKTGYVDFMFTVDAEGYLRDIEVTGGEEVPTFKAAATTAVRGFRYAPRFVDGVPVATPGVETRIRFEIGRR